jgi:hypothetical protein
MKKIVRLTESDIKRIVKRLTNKDFENEVTPFESPEEYGFTHMDQNMLKQYVKTYGPITLIGGKYACQNRRGQWECYDKLDRQVSGYEIMREFDLHKYGFEFDDFINSYQNK